MTHAQSGGHGNTDSGVVADVIYSLFPSASADYFGTRNATSNYAVLYTSKGMASIIGGWFGALLYEQSGSWTTGFCGSAALAGGLRCRVRTACGARRG